MSIENSETAAFPLDPDKSYEHQAMGLTKREYFAIKILQGIMSRSNEGISIENGIAVNECKTAVIIADELLKQLNK